MWVAWTVLCGVWASPTVAQESAEVTVLGVQGELSAGERRAVQRRLLRAVESNPATHAIDATDTLLTDTLALLGCGTIEPGCLAQLADALDTPYLLFGSLRAGTHNPSVSLTFFEAATRAIVFTVMLDAPAHAEDTRFSDAVESLLRGRCVLRVEAPEASNMTIADQNQTGSPAWFVDLDPGEHRLTVESPTHGASTVRVWVEPYRVTTVSLASSVVNVDRPRRVRAAGWSTLGLAGGLAVGAIISGARVRALQQEYSQTWTQRRAFELSEDGAATARRANFLVVAAGVALLTSSTLLITERARRSREPAFQLTATPMVGGAMGGFSVTF
jgi:hypothetical protein